MERAQSTVSKWLKWSGLTDRGKVRPNNEDSFLALQFDSREVHHLGKIGEAQTGLTDFVFAVSDGMGGAMAGELASRIATEKIIYLLPRSFKQSATGMESGFSDIFVELFDQTHRKLKYVGDADEECDGMEATLSLCWFTPDWMYFGHIGDSRIYYLSAREGTLRRLTHDDTYVDWLFRHGKLNEREARDHPRRHILQKALGGSNQFVDPQVGAVGYESGDIFLLCTDGLINGLFDEQLAELLTAPGDSTLTLAQRLVFASLERSGADNTTALVIQVL